MFLIWGYFILKLNYINNNILQVLTTVLDKDNVEGFVSILLRLASRSGIVLSTEQRLLTYQWLEYSVLFADQALANSNTAKIFLQVNLNKKYYP